MGVDFSLLFRPPLRAAAPKLIATGLGDLGSGHAASATHPRCWSPYHTIARGNDGQKTFLDEKNYQVETQRVPLSADIIVPGHGPIPEDPRETRQGLHRFRQMLVDLRDAVQKEIARGGPRSAKLQRADEIDRGGCTSARSAASTRAIASTRQFIERLLGAGFDSTKRAPARSLAILLRGQDP